MLHQFLDINRERVIERVRLKVAGRPVSRGVAGDEAPALVPFLGQLIATLRVEATGLAAEVAAASRPATGRSPDLTFAARKHGGDLLRRGFAIDEVVHEYGDLAQAVTEIALENRSTVSAEDLHTLNRWLDQAAADAVDEFDRERCERVAETDRRAMAERLGFLAHELRNFLNTATLSFAAIRSGSVAIDGATAAVLDRSLTGLRDLIERSLEDVRLSEGIAPRPPEAIAVDRFIAEVQVAARLDANARGCRFVVEPVEPGLTVHADRQLLHSAVSNLVQNAFKFTRPGSTVTLRALAWDERIFIAVEDCCGGLPEGKADSLFASFTQHHGDRSGLGLGLAISRRAVEHCGGTLGVRDLPGHGCVFTIDLPRASP